MNYSSYNTTNSNNTDANSNSDGCMFDDKHMNYLIEKMGLSADSFESQLGRPNYSRNA